VDCDLLQAIQLDVIFNFARYKELKEAVQQLVRDNLDPELMREEAHDLFESWWSSNNSQGEWNEAVKDRTWTSLWNEFGGTDVQR
jgi:hypothetical protein